MSQFESVNLFAVCHEPKDELKFANKTHWLAALDAAATDSREHIVYEREEGSDLAHEIMRHISEYEPVDESALIGRGFSAIILSPYPDMTDVLLTTAVVEDEAISGERARAWDKTGPTDPAVGATFRREYAGALRYGITSALNRNGRDTSCNVVAPICNLGILIEMHLRMKGWKFGGAWGDPELAQTLKGFCTVRELIQNHEIPSYHEAADMMGWTIDDQEFEEHGAPPDLQLVFAALMAEL
jgi:hypothetical protein